MDAVDVFSLHGRIRAWMIACRPAFHTVGVFPYALGALMAYHYTGRFGWLSWATGTLAVILVMNATHLLGECYDYREDSISWSEVPSRFAGGSGAIPKKMISRESAFYAGLASTVLAVCVGLFIWIVLDTGPWTIPLGVIGVLGGIFYSTPPVRWVSTGLGEIWIFICYGFLTVAAGIYLAMGQVTTLSMLVSIPVGATIFNVIFANEYPDYESDRIAGKNNLLSRVGREKGAWIYTLFSVAANFFFLVSVFAGVPRMAMWFYCLTFVMSVYCVQGFVRGAWRDRSKLESLCGLTIMVNLTTTMSYMLAFALF